MCALLDILEHMFNFSVQVNHSIMEHTVNVFILFISILM